MTAALRLVAGLRVDATASRRRPRRATTSRRSSPAPTPAIDPATLPERRRRPAVAHGRDRRHRRGRIRPTDGRQRARPLRPQLPSPEPGGAAVLGPGDRRRHRAEHDGEARDRAQRRRRDRRCGLAAYAGVAVVLPQHLRRVHLDRNRRDNAVGAALAGRSTSATSASRASKATSTRRSCSRPGVLTFFGNAAFTRGTVLAGDEPADRRVAGRHAAGQHHAVQGVVGVRFNDARDRWWVEYGVRVAGGRDARGADAARLAVPDRAGPARRSTASPCSAWRGA